MQLKPGNITLVMVSLKAGHQGELCILLLLAVLEFLPGSTASCNLACCVVHCSFRVVKTSTASLTMPLVCFCLPPMVLSLRGLQTALLLLQHETVQSNLMLAVCQPRRASTAVVPIVGGNSRMHECVVIAGTLVIHTSKAQKLDQSTDSPVVQAICFSTTKLDT